MRRENKILLGIPASFVQYITHTLIPLKDLRINPLYHIRCMYISKTINVSPKFGKKKRIIVLRLWIVNRTLEFLRYIHIFADQTLKTFYYVPSRIIPIVLNGKMQ